MRGLDQRSGTPPAPVGFTPTGAPLERTDLSEPFASGERRNGVQLIGLEHEKISFRLADGGFVPYAGKHGIQRFLLEMCSRYGWQPEHTEGYLLSLERDGAHITLEPGGQIELSGAPQPNIAGVKRELDIHLHEVRDVGDSLGIGVAGIGLHPSRNPFDIPFIPKPRYAVMREYFQRTGTRGLYMMGATATVQVNLDYASEAEALEKMRGGQLASPYVSAMFANSPFEHGVLTEWQSRRCFTWLDVDPVRTGLLPFVHQRDDLYNAYAEWALRAPLFGIHRGDHEFMPMPPVPFADFMDMGFGHERPNAEDWFMHLGTLYPEVRLKRTIELRGADTGSLEHAVAVAAIWHGLLDAAPVRRQLLSWLEPPADPSSLLSAVARRGLLATPETWAICRELVRLAEVGLQCLDETSACALLEPVKSALDDAMIPADLLRQKFKKQSKINALDVLLAARL